MLSDDLKKALVQLQLAALTRLASKQGISANSAALQQTIAQSGIDAAYRAMNEPRPVAPLPGTLPIERPASSFFRRIAQRWFGRT